MSLSLEQSFSNFFFFISSKKIVFFQAKSCLELECIGRIKAEPLWLNLERE